MDPKVLLNHMNPLEATNFGVRQRLCGLTEDDKHLVSAMGKNLTQEIPSIIEEFYGRLDEFEFLRAIVAKHTTIPKLKQTFEAYCKELFCGNYDQDYYQKRTQVGLTHERVGLPLNWYIGMLAYLQEILVNRIKSRALETNQPNFAVTIAALQRLMLMDQLIIVEAYVGASTKQLREEAIQATDAKKAKSLFLASMSHELRTPMNAILGFSELILSKSAEISPTTRKHLSAVKRNAENLLRLINDLLDLTKSEIGNMPLQLSTGSVSDLLDDLIHNLQTLIAQKPITILRDFDAAALGSLQLDFGKLRQIVFNLISNAAKFTEAGTISVIARRSMNKLEITIRDTGTGIAAEDQGNLFTEFYQVKTSSRGGTGLGLALCKKLAHIMNGEISLTSSLGNGCAVSIIVPIV